MAGVVCDDAISSSMAACHWQFCLQLFGYKYSQGNTKRNVMSGMMSNEAASLKPREDLVHKLN